MLSRILLALCGLLLGMLVACGPGGTAGSLEYVSGGDADEGRRKIADVGCGSCHVIPGVPGANSTVGPPLTQWADRVYIAGSLANEPENLVQWLLDPQAIEPGTAMPNLLLSEQDARDISAFLYTLR